MGATTSPPHLYIISEYCERGTLQQIIRYFLNSVLTKNRNKEIKLGIIKRVKMLLDAAKGMLYLHSFEPPILHRDLKSANLLVISKFGNSHFLKRLINIGLLKYLILE